MAKKNIYKTKPKPEVVKEPLATYVAKRILFFNSFEEMEQADAKEIALLSAIKHLQNATTLIKRVFKQELKKGTKDFKIYYK